MKQTKCRECRGTGEVVWTKERGGAVCNACGGLGHTNRDIVLQIIASILDRNNCYMSGPSQQSRKFALRVIEYLEDEELI